jgi:hypothetical protein
MTDSCRLDSGGTNEVVLPNAMVVEDVPTRWVATYAPAVDYYDSALAASAGKPGRVFSLMAVGIGFHVKYHLEQIAADSAPVKFRDHAVMFDSSGDSATAAVKVIPVNPHFAVGGASTDTAVWSFSCQLVEVT